LSKEIEFVRRNLVVGRLRKYIILQPNFDYVFFTRFDFEVYTTLSPVDLNQVSDKWQSEKAANAD
jgi:hypothetical protein